MFIVERQDLLESRGIIRLDRVSDTRLYRLYQKSKEYKMFNELSDKHIF